MSNFPAVGIALKIIDAHKRCNNLRTRSSITDGWRIGGNLEQNKKQLQTVGTGEFTGTPSDGGRIRE